jgi:hypothetical protein
MGRIGGGRLKVFTPIFLSSIADGRWFWLSSAHEEIFYLNAHNSPHQDIVTETLRSGSAEAPTFSHFRSCCGADQLGADVVFESCQRNDFMLIVA